MFDMYNLTSSVLKACIIKSRDRVSLENMILKFDDIQQALNLKVIKVRSWPYFFSYLISADYTTLLDGKYLAIFESGDLSQTHSIDFQFIVFTHWMMSKLNHSPKSLLDSSTSTEIVSIIINSIKWNHPYHFNDILLPLWINFVAPMLFDKLSGAMGRGRAYPKDLCYLNQIIGAYLSVFYTNYKPHLKDYFHTLVEKESRWYRFVVPQIIFDDIITTEGLFDIETQKRYFDLWLNDERLISINQVLDVINEPQPYEACKNSEIVKKFICSLIESNDRNHTTGAYHYLHCVLVKDRILLFQAKSRRNKALKYGYYLTIDVIKAIEQKASQCFERNQWDKFMNILWNLCKMFKRDDLVKYINSSRTRGNMRHINICIPCARVIVEQEG